MTLEGSKFDETRGLNSLLNHGGGEAVAKNIEGVASQLEIERIEVNPFQPRKSFDAKEISDLAASIKRDGVIQPLIVKPPGASGGRYVLIAGERRLRAAKEAGLSKVPVIFRREEMGANDMLRIALIENIQRSDLNVIEEAMAYESLMREHGLTQDQCANEVGKDRATVANSTRLLSLPTEVKSDLINKRLSMGHGRALLSLEAKPDILKARQIVLQKKLNVRQTEKLVKDFKKTDQQPTNQPNPDLEYLAENLRSFFRTKVRLLGNAQKGRIEISYFSPSELERLIQLMNDR